MLIFITNRDPIIWLWGTWGQGIHVITSMVDARWEQQAADTCGLAWPSFRSMLTVTWGSGGFGNHHHHHPSLWALWTSTESLEIYLHSRTLSCILSGGMTWRIAIYLCVSLWQSLLSKSKYCENLAKAGKVERAEERDHLLLCCKIERLQSSCSFVSFFCCKRWNVADSLSPALTDWEWE